MADGSIRIETKLDNSTLKQQIKELEKELKNVQKEKAKTAEQADGVKAKQKADVEFDKQFPEEMSHREEIDKKAAKELDPIIAKQEELNQKEQVYLEKLEAAKAKLAEQANVSDASKEVSKEAKADAAVGKIKTQEQYNSLLEQTQAKMEAIEAAAARVAEEKGLNKDDILKQNSEYQKLSDTMGMLKAKSSDFGKEAKSASVKAKDGLKTAKKEASGFGTALKGGIKSMAKIGLAAFGIRGAYSAISGAVREYLSTNEELAGQMDALKGAFAQVLGPAIEWVVNLLFRAIGAVNAFVQALTGINFAAKANAAALKKQSAAGGGGGNSTAGFDEQTKLSGGGGGGGATATLPDGSNIDLSFLDPFLDAIKKFKEDIQPLITTVGDLFKWLWENVLVPFGDWAVNGVLPGFLNILGAAFLVLNSALQEIKPIAQWLWDSILKPIAEWTGGVILDVLNGIGGWMREHQETLGKVVAVVGVVIGVLVGVPAVLSAIGAALSLLFSPVTLIVAAIVGLVALFVTLYDECEGFRNGMNQVWEGLKGIFGGAVEWIKALFSGDWAGMDAAWQKIKDSAVDLWNGLVEGLKAGWDWCAKKLSEIWDKIVTAFKNFFGIHSPSTMFAGFGGNMMDGLVNGIKNAVNRVVSACQQIWSAIKGVFASVGSWFKDTFSKAWQAVKDVFSKGGKIFDGIKQGIADTFKTIVNGLITGINKIISIPFNNINGILNFIRNISFLNISPFKNLWKQNPLSIPQIPKLARGGIVNNPGRGVPAIIGEAGREAVLPLDNHTEWMDILADKIGGNVTIPITLDGKRIATYVVDIQKKKAFAMNGV